MRGITLWDWAIGFGIGLFAVVVNLLFIYEGDIKRWLERRKEKHP